MSKLFETLQKIAKEEFDVKIIHNNKPKTFKDIFGFDLKEYESMERLYEVVKELEPYYDIDKVKSWAVYVWTKGNDGENVFDIQKDEIIFYDKEHKIPEEVIPIIKKIQQELVN